MKKVVIVTGHKGGIGKAIANKFLVENWQVCGVDLIPGGEIEGIHDYVADLSDISALKETLESVVKEFGRIDCIVNNAAIQICKDFEEYTIQDWDLTMNVNLRSAFFLAQMGLSELRKTKGSVVNVSSVHALATSKNISPYAISKGAMVSLTKSLAIECAKDVRINAVLPAAIDTDMLRDGLKRGHIEGANEDELVEGIGNRHVLGKVGQPNDVAEMVWFLANGNMSSFITGQSFVVDGGASIKLSTE